MMSVDLGALLALFLLVAIVWCALALSGRIDDRERRQRVRDVVLLPPDWPVAAQRKARARRRAAHV